jgi:hypothetical protein
MYKTIPMFAVAATLVAAVVLGTFGEHQSTAAKEFGGLGQFNCKTCTPLK